MIQSVNLSYARYQCIKNKGEKIDIGSYSKLFYGQKAFTRKYGLTSKELMEKYDYNAEREGQENDERDS